MPADFLKKQSNSAIKKKNHQYTGNNYLVRGGSRDAATSKMERFVKKLKSLIKVDIIHYSCISNSDFQLVYICWEFLRIRIKILS